MSDSETSNFTWTRFRPIGCFDIKTNVLPLFAALIKILHYHVKAWSRVRYAQRQLYFGEGALGDGSFYVNVRENGFPFPHSTDYPCWVYAWYAFHAREEFAFDDGTAPLCYTF